MNSKSQYPSRRPWSKLLILMLAGSTLGGGKPAVVHGAAKPVVLSNGTTLLLLPIPEADQIGIEAVYRVGFIHEPKGMTQAAHLLEHLVCNAATRSYGPNESMALLNREGMANAETLPDWTHYDYALPADQLELALKIEAERLTSLRIDRDVIQVEAPRCYQETDFVERNPRSGMMKHAFMAFAQTWRHGLPSAQVRGGLEEFALENLVRFHRASYRPGNLTLILVGGFDRDNAIELARKHLGSIESGPADPLDPIDWAKIPKRSTVRWDAKVRAVCIAFVPPHDRVDRVTLSLWGNMLHQQLAGDPAIAAVTDHVSCSNQMWNVGELPFYVYATASAGSSIEDVERALSAGLTAFIDEKPSSMVTQQIRAGAQQLAQQNDMLSWSYVKQSAAMIARQRGMDDASSQRMVLGQAAINWSVAHFLLGPKPEDVTDSLGSLTSAALHRVIQDHLSAENRFVTRLMPTGASE